MLGDNQWDDHNWDARLFFVFQVTLKECDSLDLRAMKTPADYMAAAHSTETTDKMEACMKVWIEQIELVETRYCENLFYDCIFRSIRRTFNEWQIKNCSNIQGTLHYKVA